MENADFKGLWHCVKALTMVCCASPALAADPWQDTTLIKAAAVEFAQAKISAGTGKVSIDARDLDPRLRLRRCQTDLEAYLPSGANLSNGGVVGVRCRAPVAWKLYVPIVVARHANVARTVRALSAGHRLRREDIEWVRQSLRTNEAVLIDGRDEVVGKTLRQPSAAGQVLRANMLRAAFVVRRGDRVTLAVSDAGLAIRMRGEALADAALGQRVRARNQSSGRVVEGIVRAEGLVELDVY